MFRDRDERIRKDYHFLKRKILRFYDFNFNKHSDRSSSKVIYGHMSSRKYKKAFPDAFYVSFYREPVQRIVSLYNYWKRTPVRYPKRISEARRLLLENDLSLTEFFEILPSLKSNGINVVDPDTLDFIGLTSRFQDSLKILQHYFPELKLPKEDDKAMNVNPNKALQDEYQIPQKEYYKSLIPNQIEVYEKAVAKFETEWNSLDLK